MLDFVFRKYYIILYKEKKMLKLKEKKIRELIAQTGLSVRAWAHEHGFPQTSLAGWIVGSRNIKHDNLLRLAQELHCQPEDIADVVIKMNPDKIKELEEDRREISALLVYLTTEQRKRILDLVQKIADANRAEEELIRGE